ncbi:MAG: ATP-binding cassette domain-containing protein, partial [Devosia sp.]
MALAGWGAEAASRQQAEALGRLSGHFADRLRGLTALKLFGRDAAEAEGVAEASEQLRARTMRVMRIAFLSSAILEFFAALGVAGVALYVGLTFLRLVDVRGAPLTLEAGLFCLLMAPEVYQPLRLLATHYHDRAAAKAAVGEIAAQMGELPALARAPAASHGGARIAAGPIGLELDEVGVATPDGRQVIVDASLVLKPGEHVAILGESGTGKSTLLEAIAGLRSFTGSIRLNGQALGGIDMSALRVQQAVLGQRPTIFAGTIADNIRLGRRGACDTALLVAARRAAVTDFAGEMPGGLDTPLGEGGIGLSGGEGHRVALARLYLRDPGLLLLDEPTAHLDAATEERVLDGLLDFARGRSMIVVTHSPAVAARMDRCFRIAEGRLLPTLRPARSRHGLRGAA